MRTILFMLVVLVAIVCGGGCGSNGAKAWDKEIQKWEKEGWHKEEVLGVAGEFAMTSFINSETARSLTAYWVTNGVRSSKQFAQAEKKYLILTFSKADGDTFAVVLSK